MKVRAVMTPNPTTIGPNVSIVEAMQRMLDGKISGLPVVAGDGSLLGIVTEADMMRRAELGTDRHRPRWLEFLLSPGRLAAEYAHSHGRTVQQIMTHAVVTIAADAALEDAVQLMDRQRIKRLPVLDGERLVGILSRGDLMRAFLANRPAQENKIAADSTIAERIWNEMGRQTWCPKQNVHIRVARGVAEIGGVVTDDRAREALCVLVGNIEGVNRVEDRLTTIEPLSGMIVRAPEGA